MEERMVVVEPLPRPVWAEAPPVTTAGAVVDTWAGVEVDGEIDCWRGMVTVMAGCFSWA